MPDKDLTRDTRIEVPQVVTTEHTCPHCGKVNTVKPYQVMKGYICPGCGKSIEGVFINQENAPTIEIVNCPKCKAGMVSILDGGKRYRCLSCGAEW